MSITFKIYFTALGSDTDEIHILSTSINEIRELTDFKNKLEELYPVLKGKTYSLTYLDDEGDKVSIRLNQEYKNLVSIDKPHSGVCRIYIKEIDGNNGSVGNNHVTHEGVVCDECESQIQGIRYKCLECSDYDLCEKCEGKHLHKHHLMLRLGIPTPCPVHVRTRSRDDCKTFLLTVPKSGIDEGHCDCRKRKVKEKHRKHSGRCSEKRENDEGIDRKRGKRLKRADFPDYAELFNTFMRKCDKFINPSVIILHEDEGTREASAMEHCRETVSGVANACLNTLFGYRDVPCGGKCSAGAGKEDKENKADPEEKTENPKNENEGEKPKANDSTNMEEVVKQFSSQTISDNKESPVASQRNESEGNAEPEPKSDKPNPSERSNLFGNGVELNELNNDIFFALYELLSMGFSNEDGNLLQLLIDKKGDVTKVIDILLREK